MESFLHLLFLSLFILSSILYLLLLPTVVVSLQIETRVEIIRQIRLDLAASGMSGDVAFRNISVDKVDFVLGGISSSAVLRT